MRDADHLSFSMMPTAQKIEALLFLAGEPVSKKELAKLIDDSIETINLAVTEISQSITDHGLCLVQTETHVELVTSPSVASLLHRWQASEEELSKVAAETLAIIAYRGPLARYDIDVIRGVDSRHTIRQLLRRGLIRRVLGTTAPRYEITEEFLKHLGLNYRQQLPQFDKLSNHEKLQLVLTQQETPV